MGKSSGMGQLAKGVVIGIILLLAIIGTMSILDSNKDNKKYIPVSNNQQVHTTQAGSSTPTPPIDANTNAQSTSVGTSKTNIDTSTPNAKQNPPKVVNDTTQKKIQTAKKKEENRFRPVLENERKLIEIPIPEKDKKKEKKKIEYGLLHLIAINPKTNQKQSASFIVLDKKGKKVAEVANKKQRSFRLPVGKYKVIATLKKPEDVSRNVAPVQSIKTVRIKSNKKTTQSFKLEPPFLLGVLQVSAKSSSNGRAIKANYIVQKENGETVATRNNVSNSLFKLKAGSYKVTVRSGNNSDSRTIIVDPGESTNQIFVLQETYKLGKLIVRVFDTHSSKTVNANIIITNNNGAVMQELKSVSQTELSLPAGHYKIRVTGPTGQSTKAINIVAGKALNEVFRFNIVKSTSVSIANEKTTPPLPSQQKTKVATNSPKAVTPTAQETRKPKQEQVQAKGSVLLYARNEGNNVPLKSNFYIQKTNGKNIAKKIYVESAQFSLEAGVYRVTVRSKNRKNLTKIMRIKPGERISEVFSLQSSLPKTANSKPVLSNGKNIEKQQTRIPVLAPQKPSKAVANVIPPKETLIPNGFLSVAMQPPRKTHFIVATRAGKKIVELTSVANANFKLDTGEYVVTAIHNKQRKSKAVKVRKNKTTQITFNATNFVARNQAQKNTNSISMGVLKSRIVNQNGKPLRGNLTVVNARGQVIARANSVTVGIFNLPPGPHTIILNYRGLKGSEHINIRSRKTTIQTFTIAPDRPNPNDYYPDEYPDQNQEEYTPPNQDEGAIFDFLKEKIEQEMRNNF